MSRHRMVRNSPLTPAAGKKPIIALVTDFGYDDHYVGTMKGVIASIAPDARVIDVTHGIPAQDVRSASYALWASYRFFPAGTIFVPVVDPGVGSGRGVLVAWNGKYRFVAPENGILELILAEEGRMDAVSVDLKGSPLILGTPSATFHGRDVFAPIAAYLSRGVNPESLGTIIRLKPPVNRFVSSTSERRGMILYRDHFGNCITNIRNELIEQVRYLAIERKRVTRTVRFYAEAPEKTVCMIRGSNGLVELCMKNGSAAAALGSNPSFVVQWK